MEKTVKQVCKCENCGNEAEMMVTCTLPDESEAPVKAASAATESNAPDKVKGSATCSHCGNEADMWIHI